LEAGNDPRKAAAAFALEDYLYAVKYLKVRSRKLDIGQRRNRHKLAGFQHSSLIVYLERRALALVSLYADRARGGGSD
jgi:hypothetical protein